MRRPILHSVATALIAGFALAALGFAVLAGYGAGPPATSATSDSASGRLDDGAALFEARCARCHDVAEAAAPLHEAGDRATGEQALRAFLAGHGKSAASEDPAIIDFLLAQPLPAEEPEPADDDFEL